MANNDIKAAIVTGGSRGIGAAIARRLAADGFAVTVNYAARAADAESLVADIVAAGGKAQALQGDIADPETIRKLFDATESAYGGVDVLVNNAGIVKLASFAATSDAMFDQLVAVNVKGVFFGLREAAKRLRKGGRIINFSSSVLGSRRPTYGLYSATKAAVESMTYVLAHELRGRDITVNAIAPGPTATDMFLKGKPQELIDRIAKEAPFERLGTPEEIAAAVAFLAGPDGRWVNAQTLRVNGGLV